MKFYLLTNDRGEIVECERSIAMLKAAAKRNPDGEYGVTQLSVPVTAESVRLLLAAQGGYAERCAEWGSILVNGLTVVCDSARARAVERTP